MPRPPMPAVLLVALGPAGLAHAADDLTTTVPETQIYGGSGQGNQGGLETNPVGMHGQLQSLNLVLPPLAVVVLTWKKS